MNKVWSAWTSWVYIYICDLQIYKFSQVFCNQTSIFSRIQTYNYIWQIPPFRTTWPSHKARVVRILDPGRSSTLIWPNAWEWVNFLDVHSVGPKSSNHAFLLPPKTRRKSSISPSLLGFWRLVWCLEHLELKKNKHIFSHKLVVWWWWFTMLWSFGFDAIWWIFVGKKQKTSEDMVDVENSLSHPGPWKKAVWTAYFPY